MNGLRGSNGCDIKYPASTRIPTDEETEKLYEPKQNKKVVRIITVIGYIFAVSLVAILLSLYYIFFWDPYHKHPYAKTTTPGNASECVTPACHCNGTVPPTTTPMPQLQALRQQLEQDLTKSQMDMEFQVPLYIQDEDMSSESGSNGFQKSRFLRRVKRSSRQREAGAT